MELAELRAPGIGVVDLSITNSVLHADRRRADLPLLRRRHAPGAGPWAHAGGRRNDLRRSHGTLTGAIIGDRSRPYLPLVFTLFLLIAVLNLIGLAPGELTVTSQLAVTATLAILTFSIVIIVGFARNGLGFFKLFAPSGMPWPMLFLMIPIELISFSVRPLTLAMRLFGNMLGGHVVTYMFG